MATPLSLTGVLYLHETIVRSKLKAPVKAAHGRQHGVTSVASFVAWCGEQCQCAVSGAQRAGVIRRVLVSFKLPCYGEQTGCG